MLLFFLLFPYRGKWTGNFAHRLTSTLKKNMDRYISHVCETSSLYTEFPFIFVTRFSSRSPRWQEAHFVCFLYFTKGKRFVDIVYTNKSRPLTVSNDVLLLCVWPKWLGILSCFHCYQGKPVHDRASMSRCSMPTFHTLHKHLNKCLFTHIYLG